MKSSASNKPRLEEFVKKSSRIVFDILKMMDADLDWLRLPPNVWNLITLLKRFQHFLLYIQLLMIVEGNVGLIQDFVASSTDEELQQDNLLSVGMKTKQEGLLAQ